MVEKYDLNKLKGKDFTLVLSGGAALGYAHMGVIKFLEENNLKPKEIIGTSMGALIGAMYAYGYSYDEMIEIASKNGFYKQLSLGFLKQGLMGTKKLEKFLSQIYQNKRMSQTKIDLKIIATNFDDGTPGVFDKNNDVTIADAIRCSISIPTVFSPHKLNGSYYVDGFVCSNLPIEYSSHKNIIAVDVLNAKVIKKYQPKKTVLFSKFSFLSRLSNRTFTLMMIHQTKIKLEKYKNNLFFLEPDMNGFNTYNFGKFNEISQKGYDEAKKRFKLI
ncbi:MAG: patatin-like phospholipase family protein [Candidatus Woesearchaeota archaeon]|jgi:NTE family protein|nr:patatin-like phospholipase family protein [Candidatus Woesearchaeota archaeon]